MLSLRERLWKYSDDQARDDHGRFADEGGGAGASAKQEEGTPGAKLSREEMDSLKPGTRVVHRRFGPATVVSREGNSVTLRTDQDLPAILHRDGSRNVISGKPLVGELRYESAGIPSETRSSGEAGKERATSEIKPPSTQRAPSQRSATASSPSSTTRPTTPGSTEAGGKTTTLVTAGKVTPVQPSNSVRVLTDRAKRFEPVYSKDLGEATKGLKGTALAGTRAKTLESAQRKMTTKGRSAQTIGDYLGGRIGLNSAADADTVIARLQAKGYVVQQDENLIDSPNATGYRARHVQLAMPGGKLGVELQMAPRELVAVQERAHHFYETVRSTRAKLSDVKAAQAKSTKLFQGAWAKYEKRLARTLLTKLGGQDHGPLDDAIAEHILQQANLGNWDELARILVEPIAEAASQGVLYGMSGLDLPEDDPAFTLANQDAVDWAADRAAELVGRRRVGATMQLVHNAPPWAISESTRDGLREIVVRAVSDGWSADELAQQVTDSWLFDPERAETIARTELAMAHVAGTMAAWRRAGVAGKRSIMSDLHDQDDICDINAEAGVIPMDASFPSGDDGPPYHPRCECVVVAVLAEEGVPGEA